MRSGSSKRKGKPDRRRKLPHELKLSRRTLLRGAAAGGIATLALPTLEAMLSDDGTRLADGAELPRRLLAWVFGNGNRLERWVPAQTGPNYTLSDELAPLANVKDDFTVLTNFKNYVGERRGHHDGMAGFMTGFPFTRLDPMGAPYASKVQSNSFDQIAADIVGDDTFYRSLQVGVSKRHLINQGPTLQTMSHRGADQPLMAERDPKALYDKLFNSFIPSDDPHAGLRASALDVVLMDAQRLRKKVSHADQGRLDAHLESVFELQKQIMAIPPDCNVPPKPDVELYRGDGTEPLFELNEAMVKLVAMALSCDLTRVVTYMFTGASGGAQFDMLTPAQFPNFPNAEDLSHADHHLKSHFNSDYEQEYIHKSVVISMENFAYMLETFKSIEEGTGTLLDQSAIMAFSDVGMGWSHSAYDFPLIVAGNAGGRLKTGVGHYRSAMQENVTDVSLACLKAVLPDPNAVMSFGGAGKDQESSPYSGFTDTPCSAIYKDATG
jgi:hypothetical protein